MQERDRTHRASSGDEDIIDDDDDGNADNRYDDVNGDDDVYDYELCKNEIGHTALAVVMRI